MALDSFVYIHAVGTDALYTPQEKEIHKKLLHLYSLRGRIKTKQTKLNKKGKNVDFSWRLKIVNKRIKELKEELTILLDQSLKDNIIRELDPSAMRDKGVINLFCSDLTRNLELKEKELTDELIMLNVFFFQVFKSVMLNGFMYNGEKYVYLTSSAGQIRTKRGICIKEKSLQKVEKRLMCGLTVEYINNKGGMNVNKFAAYLALSNSATDVWEGFDIRRSIVVDDFETSFPSIVDYIDYETYKITRKEMNVSIPCTDGWGMVDGETTRMIRLPWVKGLLVNFPFIKWLRQECSPDKWWVTDIYGVKHNVVVEDIKYIFTKSQFKLYKFYESWNQYCDYFEAYGCQANYCNMEEPYISKAKLNYQMLQQLSCMTDKEIKKVVASTNENIRLIGTDFQKTMQLLGATKENKNKNYMQEALLIYPELMQDEYNKEVLRQVKRSEIKKAKAGKLRVNAKYLFVSPNPIPFCRWLFLGEQNPIDELRPNEVYTNQFKDGDELAVMRSPSLGKEWCVRTNVRNAYFDKWLGNNKCIYTSSYDMISKILSFDCDGDKLLCIKNKTLIEAAKREMKDVVPLYYEMKKAVGGLITPETKYEGISKAFVLGNIGTPSNLISIVHNNGQENRKEANNVIKWLTMEVNYIIDGSKTLFFLTRPKEVDEIIKKHTRGKLPAFFKYAKDKNSTQVEAPNNSVMNKISKSIVASPLKFNNHIDKFDWTMLLDKTIPQPTKEDYELVVKTYKHWMGKQRFMYDNGEDNHFKGQLYKNKILSDNMIVDTGLSREFIANVLTRYLYNDVKSSAKKFLWELYGDILVNNLCVNVPQAHLGQVCQYCGKRFFPDETLKQIYCSDECYKEKNKLKAKERKRDF